MLSPSYTYIFLDFETTGLDLSSDFPIQIALVQTDHHLTVLHHYTRYISLPESITRLRSNVSYMTGIDIETIESQGQSLETIQSEIADFFGPETVLIGQNISFDIGFLKKVFPGCEYAHSIDTYPLACSSIPYLKSYSLESIDQHLASKYTSYEDKEFYLLTTLSEGNTLSAHDALYDCIAGLCFISRWCDQITRFSEEFPIVDNILAKTEGEGITTVIARNEAIHNNKGSLYPKSTSYGRTKVEMTKKNLSLPILTAPLTTTKNSSHDTIINRPKTPNHSKRSTTGADLPSIIAQLPHPCIIAVSHGSKIDIIKQAYKDEQFDYLKEEQIIDQEKLSLRLDKASYTEEERLFVIFYLSHHHDGYRVLHPTLTTHKYILDYLQIKKIELKKDKKILCTQGGLYYTMDNNPHRKEIYKDYPICILDADRRHTTYNDYAQKGIGLNTILYQREKYAYESQQLHTQQSKLITSLITSLTFFIAHISKENETYYEQHRQYKREIDYLLTHHNYSETAASRGQIQLAREHLLTQNDTVPGYIIDLMDKLSNFLSNPLKIQRKINHNKEPYYTLAPSVRYIDFAEYLRMFGDHKVLFFSPNRSEYQSFLPKSDKRSSLIIQEYNDINAILLSINKSNGSVFIISHNADKSKKLFATLHEQGYDKTYDLIGEYLTGGIAKNAIKHNNKRPSIIIGGYHMLLHFWGEGNIINHIIIHYIHHNMKNFIYGDMKTYAITS